MKLRIKNRPRFCYNGLEGLRLIGKENKNEGENAGDKWSRLVYYEGHLP